MTLQIQTALAAQTFVLGEKVPLVMAVANPGPGAVSAINPRAAGYYLRFFITVPGGGRRTFTMDEATRAPGVPPTINRIQCPPDYRWDFEFDLTVLTALNQPGIWTVRLEYEPEPGQKWNSPEMLFTILPPAGSTMELVPDDSAFSAQRILIWAEKNGGTERILGLPLEKLSYAPPMIRSAIELGRAHLGASVAASTSPANLSYPDRWLAWVNRRRLLAFYWSREPGWRLAPVQIDLGFEPTLIHPLLAAAPPDEGRPTCLVGMHWVNAGSSGLIAYELGEQGVGKMLPAVTLGGPVQAAWAVSPSTGNRVFILALASGNRIDLVSVSCPAGDVLQPPHTVYSIPGKLVSGDVRVLPDGQIAAGLIVQNGEEWQRVTFAIPPTRTKVEAKPENIRPGRNSRGLCARLDEVAGLHWAFWRENIVEYMAPGAEESSWSSHRLGQYGSHFSISLRENPSAVAILYYDSERGPVFVRI